MGNLPPFHLIESYLGEEPQPVYFLAWVLPQAAPVEMLITLHLCLSHMQVAKLVWGQ